MAAVEQPPSKDGLKRRRHRSTISSAALDAEANDLIQQWEILSKEIDSFEHNHQNYLAKLEEVEKLKKEHRIAFKKIQTKVNNLNKSIDVHQSLIVIPDDDKQNLKSKDKSELLRIRRESEKKNETPEDRRDRLSSICEHLTKHTDYLKRIK